MILGGTNNRHYLLPKEAINREVPVVHHRLRFIVVRIALIQERHQQTGVSDQVHRLPNPSRADRSRGPEREPASASAALSRAGACDGFTHDFAFRAPRFPGQRFEDAGFVRR
jgi:hypothetical protein